MERLQHLKHATTAVVLCRNAREKKRCDELLQSDLRLVRKEKQQKAESGEEGRPFSNPRTIGEFQRAAHAQSHPAWH